MEMFLPTPYPSRRRRRIIIIIIIYCQVTENVRVSLTFEVHTTIHTMYHVPHGRRVIVLYTYINIIYDVRSRISRTEMPSSCLSILLPVKRSSAPLTRVSAGWPLQHTQTHTFISSGFPRGRNEDGPEILSVLHLQSYRNACCTKYSINCTRRNDSALSWRCRLLVSTNI